MLDLWSQTGIYLLFGHAEGSISGIIATTADMLACGTSKKNKTRVLSQRLCRLS